VLVAQRRANRLVTIFPRDHGRRLARLLPQGRFELITHSRTFIPEDQPDLLVTAIEDFLAAHPTGTE
jgi:pimeloyl-ACP methyl ester carboxylesterase